jgi:hypothetical protein
MLIGIIDSPRVREVMLKSERYFLALKTINSVLKLFSFSQFAAIQLFTS